MSRYLYESVHDGITLLFGWTEPYSKESVLKKSLCYTPLNIRLKLGNENVTIYRYPYSHV
jgi:hypothetical protein